MAYWLNGAVENEARALSIDERGFLLGDGIFETILLVDGVAAFWTAHLQRLNLSLAQLGIAAEVPPDMPAILRELAALNGCNLGRAVARITATRGPAGRGLAPQDEVEPTLLATVAPNRSPPSKPMTAVISRAARRTQGSVSARCKTIGYADSIVARREAIAGGADDAIMLNGAERVACASAANIFVAGKEEYWRTPPLSEGALPGIVRAQLLAAPDLVVVESAIAPAALAGAAKFISNSLIGVHPIFLKDEMVDARQLEKIEKVCSVYRGRLAADLEARAKQL